jgi:hypothetical protein
MSFQSTSEFEKSAQEKLFNHLYQKQVKNETNMVDIDELENIKRITQLKQQMFDINQNQTQNKPLTESDKKIMEEYQHYMKLEKALDQCKILELENKKLKEDNNNNERDLSIFKEKDEANTETIKSLTDELDEFDEKYTEINKLKENLIMDKVKLQENYDNIYDNNKLLSENNKTQEKNYNLIKEERNNYYNIMESYKYIVIILIILICSYFIKNMSIFNY